VRLPRRQSCQRPLRLQPQRRFRLWGLRKRRLLRVKFPKGGTGGIGQIVSVGKDEFTMKRNDDGSDQVVHLASQATIRTSAGPASLSDLKAGYPVTLAGSPDPDGSFTARIVLVCNGVVP